jgi:Domain of unknown function (DUF4304)
MGFVRKNATWNRKQGQRVEVIDIQNSKDGETVTMNIGVLDRDIYTVCWGRASTPFVEEPSCTIRCRIGQLIDNKDRWWSVDSATTVEEMVECLKANALPFLNRMQSLEEMRDWLAPSGVVTTKYPPDSINFAVILSRLNETRRACSILSELGIKALGAWKTRAKEVYALLGCDHADH